MSDGKEKVGWKESDTRRKGKQKLLRERRINEVNSDEKNERAQNLLLVKRGGVIFRG